ncbi:MAG: acylphosphatase [Candidatus Thermoplasmatota archaeon]
MRKRATIIISGDVQDVGFRAVVMRMAQKAGLVGYVENLPNGTVRAICEGEEKVIKEFVKKLEIHNEEIDVEDTHVEWSESQNEFEDFRVKITDLGSEMFQGFATAGRMLGKVSQKIDHMHADLKAGFADVKGSINEMHTDLKNEICTGFKDTKDGLTRIESAVQTMHTDLKDGFTRVEGAVKEMHEDQTEGFARVEGSINEMHTDLKNEICTGFKDTKDGLTRIESAVQTMHTDTNQSFAVMDQKYGMISQQMTIAITELQKTTSALVSLTEKIGALIDKKLAE